MIAPLLHSPSSERTATPMAVRSVVAISGSPSVVSKTAILADLILDRLAGPSRRTRHLRVRDFFGAHLLEREHTDAVLNDAIAEILAADGIVIATPIYKAAPSGLLKLFLDALPQFAFAGKAVLPLGTGGSIAHMLALDYSLRPILHSMGARHVVQSFFLFEKDGTVSDGSLSVDAESNALLQAAIEHFDHSVTAMDASNRYGHPRPHALS